MDLSRTLLEYVTKPTFPFSHDSQVGPLFSTSPSQSTWDCSPVNPKNLVGSESLDGERLMWRIDGVTTYGTQFFIIPVGPRWDSVPRRIDLFIPSQEHHPDEWQTTLQSHLAVSQRDSKQISDLGISRQLCRAMELHCRRDPTFPGQYMKLPFGSKMSFDKIAMVVDNMELSIHPAYDLERKLKTPAELQQELRAADSDITLPDAIDIFQLRLESQIHDSVSLVTMRNDQSSSAQRFVFKSCADEPQFLYHELKMLLTLKPHVHILRKPLFLVTKTSSFGGKKRICGFIVPYYPLGSMRDILPRRRNEDLLTFEQNIKWSLQVTSALEHVYRTRRTFYSDLRPDNVLLSPSPLDPFSEDATLIDFEQRGNWYEWCPPEILYRMYLDKLRPHFNSMTAQHKRQWEEHTRRYLFVPPDQLQASHGSNAPWFSLTLAAQEKASVYCLGLLIYCIFEGVSNVCVSLSNAFRHEPDISFPMFKRTPADVQKCIRKCTIGSPAWTSDSDDALIRRGTKLYPKSVPEDAEMPKDLAELILDATTKYWNRELRRAEDYFSSCLGEIDDEADQRPSLSQVYQELEKIKHMIKSDTK